MVCGVYVYVHMMCDIMMMHVDECRVYVCACMDVCGIMLCVCVYLCM